MVSATSSSVSSRKEDNRQQDLAEIQQETANEPTTVLLQTSYQLQRNVSETQSSSQANVQPTNVQHLLGQHQESSHQAGQVTIETRQLLQHEANKNVGGQTYTYQTREGNLSNLNADSPMSAFGADAYHSETRKISSVVVESTIVGDQPNMQDRVRYVEVPTVEEQVKYVTVYEKREVEKRVPKYEVEYVDKIVEVPKVVYVDVPNAEKKYVERRVEKPVPYFVDRPREVLREVKVPKTRYVEKTIEVPGDVIEVPKYYDVENRYEVPRYVDREVPVVVAQTIKPIITESGRSLAVDVLDYEPEITTINVHIAKPVASALEVVGQRDVRHRLVNITSGQYNTILKQLNAHMDEKMRQCLPYVADGGRVAFVGEQEAHFIVAPDNIEVEGWNRARTEVQTRQVLPSLQSQTYLESQHANRAACCNTRATKKATNAEGEITTRGAPSSVYQQTSVVQTIPVSGTTTRIGGTHSANRDASASKSQQHSHVHTEHSAIYTENVGDEQVRQDGSTVLSHRPQQRSRICC